MRFMLFRGQIKPEITLHCLCTYLRNEVDRYNSSLRLSFLSFPQNLLAEQSGLSVSKCDKTCRNVHSVRTKLAVEKYLFF